MDYSPSDDCGRVLGFGRMQIISTLDNREINSRIAIEIRQNIS